MQSAEQGPAAVPSSADPCCLQEPQGPDRARIFKQTPAARQSSITLDRFCPFCRSRRDSAGLGRASKRHRPRVENEMTRKLRNAATPPSDADSAPVQLGAPIGPGGTAVANGVGAAEQDDSQPAGELMDHGLAVHSAGHCPCNQKLCGH